MPDQSTFTPHLEPTQEAGREFFSRSIQGPVVMLNLLRFRKIADYGEAPQLAPAAPISGEAAYKLYMDHTLPLLKKSGGKVLFYGSGGKSDQSYLLGVGHRTAALEDSRLLPLVEEMMPHQTFAPHVRT